MMRAMAAAEWISIHAPARGATRTENGFQDALDISIHAPARGATSSKIQTG